MNIQEQIDLMPDATDVYVGKGLTVADVKRSLERLNAVFEIADGIQALHKGKEGGLGQWKELREAIAAVKTGE